MAVERYSGNRLTGLSTDTKPTTTVVEGSSFEELDTGKYFLFYDSSWNELSYNVNYYLTNVNTTDLSSVTFTIDGTTDITNIDFSPDVGDINQSGATDGQVIKWDSKLSQWVPDTVTASVNAAGSDGQVQFNDSSALGADANFHWDNTNKRLGVGPSSPITKIEAEEGYTTTYSETTASRNLLRISNNSQTDNSYASIDFAVRNAAGSFGNAHISAISIPNESSADIAFQVRNSGQTIEAMRITKDGKTKSLGGFVTGNYHIEHNTDTDSLDFNYIG